MDKLMNETTSTEHLFWARELIQLARKQASGKGVPDHVMAQAMLVQSWMLFTGEPEAEAAKSVSRIYAKSIAKVAAKGSATGREAGKTSEQ